MSLPDAYEAVRFEPPMSSTSDGGAPEYTTGSLKPTTTSILYPAGYAPSGRGESTPATAPDAAVMLTSEVATSDPGDPGTGSARLALLPARSTRLPPAARTKAPVPA